MGKDFLQTGVFDKDFFLKVFSETLKKNYIDVGSNKFLIYGQDICGVVKHKDTGKKYRIEKWNFSTQISIKEIQ